MSLLDRFYKPFWFTSFILLSAAFFLAYSALGEEVIYYQNDQTGRVSTIPKETFFFGGVAVILVTNLMLYVFSKLVLKTSFVDKDFLNRVANWFILLPGLFNSFFILSLLFIVLYNRDSQFNPVFFGVLFYLFGFGMIFWLIRLAILLVRRPG